MNNPEDINKKPFPPNCLYVVITFYRFVSCKHNMQLPTKRHREEVGNNNMTTQLWEDKENKCNNRDPNYHKKQRVDSVVLSQKKEISKKEPQKKEAMKKEAPLFEVFDFLSFRILALFFVFWFLLIPQRPYDEEHLRKLRAQRPIPPVRDRITSEEWEAHLYASLQRFTSEKNIPRAEVIQGRIEYLSSDQLKDYQWRFSPRDLLFCVVHYLTKESKNTADIIDLHCILDFTNLFIARCNRKCSERPSLGYLTSESLDVFSTDSTLPPITGLKSRRWRSMDELSGWAEKGLEQILDCDDVLHSALSLIIGWNWRVWISY